MSTTYFLWDEADQNIIEEYEGNFDKTVEYTHEPGLYGGVISQHRSDLTSFYHEDALGSTVALTDESEEVTDSYAYDAWGNEVSHTGTTENPFRWNGQAGYYWNKLTDDYFVRARVYKPTVGRWISVDLMFSYSFSNNFTYTFNSPIIEVDPSGLQAQDKALSVEISENWISPQFDNARCGERASIGWIFRVRRKRDQTVYTPGNGVFVQKVTVTCTRKLCGCGVCLDPEVQQTYAFYEAFRIEDGKIIDEKTVIQLGGAGRATDKAETQSFRGTCGTHKAEGEVRFFSAEDAMTIVKSWKTGLTHGMETNCPSFVGDLYSVNGDQVPGFWKDSPFNIAFASANRHISAEWKCCGAGDDKTTISAAPRKR